LDNINKNDYHVIPQFKYLYGTGGFNYREDDFGEDRKLHIKYHDSLFKVMSLNEIYFTKSLDQYSRGLLTKKEFEDNKFCFFTVNNLIILNHNNKNFNEVIRYVNNLIKWFRSDDNVFC
jgi:hypothetical protein